MQNVLFIMVLFFLLFIESCKTNPDMIVLKKTMQQAGFRLDLENIPEIDYSDITKDSKVKWIDQFGQYLYVDSMTCTKDGKYIVSKSAAEPLKIRHIQTGKIVSSFGHLSGAFFITPDSKHIVYYNTDKTIELYTLTGTLLKSMNMKKEGIKYFNYCDYGKYFIIVSENNTTGIYDPLAFTCIKNLTLKASIISSSGDYLISILNNKEVILYNTPDGSEIIRMNDPDSTFDTIISSPNGLIASAGRDSILKLWNTKGILLKKWELDPNERIHFFCFSEDGKYCALSFSTFIEIWEIETEKCTVRYDTAGNTDVNRKQIISAAVFLPGNKYIACGTEENTILLNLITGKPERIFKSDSFLGRALDFSGNGNYLAIGFVKAHFIGRSEIGIWDIKNGKVRTFKQTDGFHFLWNLDINARGEKIISSGVWDNPDAGPGELFLWDINGKYKTIQFPEVGSIFSVSFGRNDRYFIATTSMYDFGDGYNLLLFRSDGEFVRVIHRDTSLNPLDLSLADFSADGKYIAGVTSEGIAIWNFDGSLYKKIQMGRYPRFHPDSSLLACTPDYKKVLLYDFQNNKVQHEIVFEKGDSNITGISFSQDGKYLVVVHGENSGTYGEEKNSDRVSIAEVSSGKIVKTCIEEIENGIDCAKLSRDNKFLAIIENLWTVKIINIQTNKYLIVSNFESGHWVVYDDELNFDYSQGGEDFIGLVNGLGPLTKKEYERFYKPGLFVRFFKGGDKP